MTDRAAGLRQHLTTERDFMGQHYPLARHAAYGSLSDFVLQHGQDFEYQPKPRGKGYRMGRVGNCFQNAYRLAAWHDDLTYVEGYAWHLIPVHHAWVVDGDGRVIETTWRLKPGEQPEYLGVPMPMRLVNAAISLSGYYGVLADYRNHWPLMQEPFEVESAIERLHALMLRRTA